MTIQKPHINELRYVNGMPDPNERPDQTRIGFMKDGEPIKGASGDTKSDGVLNRPSVHIQENVVTNLENTKAQQVTIEELVDAVNEITGSEGADFGSRITTNENKLVVHERQLDSIEFRVGTEKNDSIPSVPQPATGLFKRVGDIETNVGVRSSQDVPNEIEKNISVRDDLFFIKRRIGNDRGLDWNGNPSPTTPPTGMKLQIEDLYNTTSAIKRDVGDDHIGGTIKGRIKYLEDSSQIGATAQLRGEMGPRDDRDPARPVYARLDEIEDAAGDLNADVVELQDIIKTPVVGLVDVVADHQTEIDTLNLTVGDNVSDVSDIQVDIGSWGDSYSGTIKGRQTEFNNEIVSLWNTIGSDDIANGTIRYRVTTLENSLGDRNNPAVGSAWYFINDNSGDITVLQNVVADLQNVVGDGTSSGLAYRINQHDQMIGNGDSVYGNGFTLVDGAEIDWTDGALVDHSLTFGDKLYFNGEELLVDAPHDQQFYVRQNGAWVVGGSGGGVNPEAGFGMIPNAVIKGTDGSIEFDLIKYANDSVELGSVDSDSKVTGQRVVFETNTFADLVATFASEGPGGDLEMIHAGNIGSYIQGGGNPVDWGAVENKPTTFDSTIPQVNGLEMELTDISDELTRLDSEVVTKIGDSVSDGEDYVRRDGEWRRLGNTGVTSQYNYGYKFTNRAQDGVWSALAASPSDGNHLHLGDEDILDGGQILTIKSPIVNSFAMQNGGAVQGWNQAGDAKFALIAPWSNYGEAAYVDEFVKIGNGQTKSVFQVDDLSLTPVVREGLYTAGDAIDHDIWHDGNREAPKDGNSYMRNNGAWVKAEIEANVVTIQHVNDFPDQDSSTIFLSDKTVYRVAGPVDLAGKTFDNINASMPKPTPITVAFVGNDPFIDKLITSSENPMLGGDNITISMQGLGLKTNGNLFNYRNTDMFGFIHFHRVNVDGAIGLGQILGYNELIWTAGKFSFLWGDAGECQLTMGNSDVIDENGTPTGEVNSFGLIQVKDSVFHAWSGELFDIIDPIREGDFNSLTLPFSNTTQKIFADGVGHDSIQSIGLFAIHDTSAIHHHEFGGVLPVYNRITHEPDWENFVDDLDATGFMQASASGAITGPGIPTDSERWDLQRLGNIPESEHFIRVNTEVQESVSITDTDSLVFDKLTGLNVRGSRCTFVDTPGDRHIIDANFYLHSRNATMNWDLYITQIGDSGATSGSVVVSVLVEHPDGSQERNEQTIPIRLNMLKSVFVDFGMNLRYGSQVRIYTRSGNGDTINADSEGFVFRYYS